MTKWQKFSIGFDFFMAGSWFNYVLQDLGKGRWTWAALDAALCMLCVYIGTTGLSEVTNVEKSV